MPNTREKLVELLSHATFGVNKQTILSYLPPSAIAEVVGHLIANGVTVQEWISVKDRLPEDEELVLILCKNGARFVGYCGKQYADFERRWRIKTALNSTKLLNLGRVTHWMPLPEPPKGE